MWPWEHAAVGYLAYSLLCHLVYRESPSGIETVAVVVAALAPDLIDKPLAWQFGVLESSYAVGHSIFVAVPLAIVVGLLARHVGRPRAGLAFAVSYLVHLPGDFVPHYLEDGSLPIERVLWPIAGAEGSGARADPLALATEYFREYVAELTAADPSTRYLLQLGIVAATVLLWLYDGAPILRECYVGLRRAVARRLSRTIE